MLFSHIPVFMAGANNFTACEANTVVVSISSHIPEASLPITFAEHGAIINKSAFFANDTCFTSYEKFLSNVSTTHLFDVNVSNVSGLMNFVAFAVINTCTSACCFTNSEASIAVLYAAILPVTPSTIVFPVSILTNIL